MQHSYCKNAYFSLHQSQFRFGLVLRGRIKLKKTHCSPEEKYASFGRSGPLSVVQESVHSKLCVGICFLGD